MAYRVFFLSCFLLLFCAEVYGADIPALQEWYHINSTMEFTVFGPMSYIPNFDTANGGYHTTVMGVIRGQSGAAEVWYHRYKEDTESQYHWRWLTDNITQVDLDGNRVLDYLSYGRIIRGTKNGSPPEDTMTAIYNWFRTSGSYTAVDLNDDGISDVIANLNNAGGGQLFSILVGGPDLKQLKYTLVPRTLISGILDAEYFFGLLKNKASDSSYRVVTMCYDADKKYWCSLVLKRMTTEMIGDSLSISLQTLDSIPFNTLQTGDWIFNTSFMLHRSQPDNKEYLLASFHNFKGKPGYTVAYDFVGDKLTQVARFSREFAGLYDLDADINGDGYSDWAGWSNGVLYFYAGQRDGIDTVAFGSYQLPCSEGVTHIHAIGDVNSDDIRDMAVALQPYSGVDGCFAIILGAPLRTVDVPEPVTGYRARTFDMQQNYPNPIGTDRKTFLPITTERPDNFTLELYDFTGRLIGTLFTATLPVGNHVLTLDLTKYSLSAGMYVVRLRGTTSTRERAILID